MTKIKKFKRKTHKGTQKRLRVSNGDDPRTGIISIDRINNNHRNIGKSRTRLLKGKKRTTLKQKHFKKFRRVM